MDKNSILQSLKTVESEHGRWSAHYVRLPHDVYTMESYNPNHVLYLRRITQVVVDQFGEDLRGKRFLDLGCLEGGFAIELALRGADVVALEAREANLAKLRFVMQHLNLRNIEAVCGDARKISSQELGTFDGILCLGLLYHFEFDAIPNFLSNLFAMTNRLAIIDTHISLFNRCSFDANGFTYTGGLFNEHGSDDTQSTKNSRNWASLDNNSSFFPTKESLLNLLADAGFPSAYVCEAPYYKINLDRLTVVAVKSARTALRSIDNNLAPSPRYPSEVNLTVVDTVNRLPVRLG